MAGSLRETIHDELLVLRSQQREKEAFALLVERWQQPLFRYALRATGDRESALDAVQETWVAVIRGLVGLKEISRFKVWLFRVLNNKCKDRHRDKARSEALLQAAAECLRTHAAADSGNSAGLWEFVGNLPFQSQTVLTLMYGEGFSVSEIAQVLGIPEGTVKSRLHHAREAVRKAVERNIPWKNGNSS